MKHATTAFLLLVLALGSFFVGCAPAEESQETALTEQEPARARPGDWVTIPAGEFLMGSNQRPKGVKTPQLYEPEHKVSLGSYQIGVFEVTNAEFARFQIESDYAAEGDWRQFYTIGNEDRPVANVTWQDAREYCEWAGGRLPTEAEWERAARGPDNFPYPWGEKWDPTKSNCNEMGYHNLVDVGQIQTDKSAYGVHDMMGNVVEWTSEKLKPYPKSPARRDRNFKLGYISVRGGSYAMKGSSFYLWTRGAYLPKAQYGIGFRCAKDVEVPPSQTPSQ